MYTRFLLAFAPVLTGCAEVVEICPDVGPPCGLSVDFADHGRLDEGTYRIEVETLAGLTTCELEVAAVSQQTEAEAEADDDARIACGGACEDRCAGPDEVYPRRDGLTIVSDDASVSVAIVDLATGARSAQVFTPSWAPHPEACAACDVASDAMPLPAAP